MEVAGSGTSRATGVEPRRMTISSPASTRLISSESRVLTSLTGIDSVIRRGCTDWATWSTRLDVTITAPADDTVTRGRISSGGLGRPLA